MYVTDLELQDVRCIARTRIEFSHPDRADAESLVFPNLNVLVGLNGGGKSTILKGLLLALMGQDLGQTDRGWRASWPRRGGQSDCASEVGLLFESGDLGVAGGGPEVRTHPSRRKVVIRRRGAGLQASAATVRDSAGRLKTPGYFLIGYGASREVAEDPATDGQSPPSQPYSDALARVASLLFGDVRLTPLEAWLAPRDKRFKEIMRLVDDLLPAETRFEGKREKGRYLFNNRGVPVPRRALSDGLQSYLAWMTDLVLRLVEATPDGTGLHELAGVVLVDEIDQRMHPRWQQSVMARLGGALPRLQFLMTSHSPLVAGDLLPQNLILLEEDRNAPGVGATRARRLTENVYGATADQVLTSSYFDLEMSRSLRFQKRLRKLSLAARAGDEAEAQKAALEHMDLTSRTARGPSRHSEPRPAQEPRRVPLKPSPRGGSKSKKKGKS